ncbi:hypothetical protein KAFR_0G00470 [Kazachstania africana CBS 2517]|uniref:Ribosomal protein/NADH dehydrogenase domain-containing protein n=1 Tax=Kazachstania africana (strain ATCC 22294 / BCRC 22015 / CBS 2517 / CECT 1963 / NBRC 1671 / NRRL Y-8276) TaxID=1071382 RepID=H2AXI0_KAZAF|nr:hypothetical protein KAFR_0G00470 [Kazachstania africana CBS 2517]CCF59080.1 hypothetical protein KAFR_0G00470 [Kazachstania africana CBS 2517]
MSKILRQINFLNKISYVTKKPQIFINTEKYNAIRLTFQVLNHGGHMGARQFWRKYLPTLQFYNPNFRIDLVRIKNEEKKNEVPCVMEIIGKDNSVVETIDMKDRQYDSIMDELLEKLDHNVVPEDKLVKVGEGH